jgi:hypothetical protein
MPKLSPGQVWDLAVESTLRQANTRESRSSTLAMLPLRPVPERRQLPGVPRIPGAIDPALRSTIRALVDGELPWPLFLFGPPGTGKTCAALCLLDHADGEYFTINGLCERLIQAQAGRINSYACGEGRTTWPEHLWQVVEKITALVTDELGCRERVSAFHYETLKKAIDLRYGKPTVFISNLDLPGLQRIYDDRVTSRLAAGTVVLLDGPDRRLQR